MLTEDQLQALKLFAQHTEPQLKPWHLAGPRLAPIRQQIMELLRGKKVPVSLCGVTALRRSLYDLYQPEGECQAAMDDDFARWVREQLGDVTSPTPAQAQQRTRLQLDRRPGEVLRFPTEHGEVTVTNASATTVRLSVEAPVAVRFEWPGRRPRNPDLLEREQSPAHQAIADRWVGEECWLDDQPAKITGRLLRFGRVAPLDSDLSSVEFAWETIDLVMTDDRRFYAK